MIRVVLLIAASLVVLSGCGAGDSHDEDAATMSAAATTVNEQNYADQIVKAFRATYSSKAEGADAASAADWSAFVATIKTINPRTTCGCPTTAWWPVSRHMQTT